MGGSRIQVVGRWRTLDVVAEDVGREVSDVGLGMLRCVAHASYPFGWVAVRQARAAASD